jgi:hypothetical protein
VGNSKAVFLALHFLFLFYELPAYIFTGIPETLDEYPWWHVTGLITLVIMWVSLYAVHLTEPGYLKQDTVEYQTALRKVGFFLFQNKVDFSHKKSIKSIHF